MRSGEHPAGGLSRIGASRPELTDVIARLDECDARATGRERTPAERLLGDPPRSQRAIRPPRASA
jgi:hypothetical protein